jgi:hypothetical protein
MRKTVSAVLAFWPLAMMVAMFVSFFLWEFEDPKWFGIAWLVGAAVFLVAWIHFLWDVWHNVAVPAEKRALWTAVLVFAGPYAMPFYFWFYVRPAVPPN